jgi:hypothetical protein
VAEGYLFSSGNDGQVFGESSNVVDSCYFVCEHGKRKKEHLEQVEASYS